MTADLRISIVGGGPRATYALERLSARVDELTSLGSLRVDVFEVTGEFGSGWVHSPTQSPLATLNRTADQVSFAADESSDSAGRLSPSEHRLTLAEWVDAKNSGQDILEGSAGAWLPRKVHGEALQAMFSGAVSKLRANENATVNLHERLVTDIDTHCDGFSVVTSDGEKVEASHVLLVTGHSVLHEQRSSLGVVPGTSGLVEFPYPLLSQLSTDAVPAGAVVAIEGMGLTMIDVAFELTLGRGGTIEKTSYGAAYRASVNEPRLIIPFSRSGQLPMSRPSDLAKSSPLVVNGEGRFLTEGLVRQIRHSRGVVDGENDMRLLDFEVEIMPVVVLEMAYHFYATLFGPEATEIIMASATSELAEFLSAIATDTLTPGRVDRLVVGTETRLAGFTESMASGYFPTSVHLEAHSRWSEVVRSRAFGRLGLENRDPGNDLFRFRWEDFDPVNEESVDLSAEDRHRNAVQLLELDAVRGHLGAALSPHKAAANAVWRELRHVISSAVDNGGLTVASDFLFRSKYVRLHNRMANGASPEAIEKLAVLARNGRIFLGCGPESIGFADPESVGWRIKSKESEIFANVLVRGHVPVLDPAAAGTVLYPNLVSRGLMHTWNRSTPQAVGVRAGIHVDSRNHPIGTSGVEHRVTVLGPPLEGQRPFQVSAMRPGCDHAVMREIVQWVNELISSEQIVDSGPESPRTDKLEEASVA